MNELEKQLIVMERLVKDDADIHLAFIEMTNLMRMIYEYLEEKSIVRMGKRERDDS